MLENGTVFVWVFDDDSLAIEALADDLVHGW
jgi:hypothetical protein